MVDWLHAFGKDCHKGYAQIWAVVETDEHAVVVVLDRGDLVGDDFIFGPVSQQRLERCSRISPDDVHVLLQSTRR